MISIETARELLDFAGGTATQKARLTPKRAEEQLEGAVALHNTLAEKRFAYLADEVGLGKTYVALGAFALFRHFDPRFRLLVIAPKKNIQQKWIKEMRNFARNNVKFADMRVKAVHDAPARPPVYCENLYEFVWQTSIDPDRDFFLRLTSFSFGLADEPEGWKVRREKLQELLPWLRDDDFDLRSKERFKENYARAVCCAIPEFDLVIVDEGHNLKHGLQKSSALRNRLVAMAFGNDTDPATASERKRFRHYGPRAKRVLFLSATPVEDDYRHIWNQLDVFGLGADAPLLADRNSPDEEKRKLVSSFLIRRVSNLESAGSQLTKNLYRREWRSGGVTEHDMPLPVPDERQRLIVALVQKKVSELLANERFNHSFQIGMLASFESFFKTAKVPSNDDEAATFDDAEQTDDLQERQGIDVDEVNRLAENYRRTFGTPMPHPKMDALVEMMRSSFDSGRKALVFVRRVASVKEIKQKLDAEYDKWIFVRLRNELKPELRDRLETIIGRYESERESRRQRLETALATADEISPDEEDLVDLPEDTGGNDTFFAWFFRGEGPAGVLSGAAVAKRFIQSRFALSSFFSDNYAADLLGVRPGGVFEALQAYTKWDEARLRSELESRAGRALRGDQKKRGHFDLFFAFQNAAVSILTEVGGPAQQRARTVLQVFPPSLIEGAPVQLRQWLEVPTFFTLLRERRELRKELWPEEPSTEYAPEFRRREFRRELIGSMFRLGHSFIDLYIALANQLGRLDTRGAEGEDLDNEKLARDLLDLLEKQSAGTSYRAYQELDDAATNFDLIVDVNAPGLWESERRLDEVPREVGRLLRAQQPNGGMSGEVNKTLVQQFRMPGYPFILVTTDLLQEGEDLHLFCSDVYHYGISWMPSSMEQRIGRIDRVRSHTERRLTSLDRPAAGDDLLQVYFPYLRETVEVFQVNRVLERMDRFLRLMHESLGSPEEERERKLNLIHEIQHAPRRAEPIKEPLRSAFPVRPEMLRGPRRSLAVSREAHDELLQWFWHVQDALVKHGVSWDVRSHKISRIGSTAVGDRRQGFTIFLHSLEGVPNVRCVSPVGQIEAEEETEAIAKSARPHPVRVAAVYDKRFHRYNLTAEADVVLHHSEVDVDRLSWLIRVTTAAADDLEKTLLRLDADSAQFKSDLEQEPHFER